VKRIAGIACVIVLVALAPGAARADDASLARTVATWSLKILPAAKALQNVNASSTKAQVRSRALALQRVAQNAANAIASQTASSAKGRSAKAKAQTAFADYAQSGKLMASAIASLGSAPKAQIVAKINKAVALAKEGSTLLVQSGKLLAQLAK
jgi:hypothetical protein